MAQVLFLLSLVSALIESGLPKFHILITESVPTNRQRLVELVEHARKTDQEIAVEEIHLNSDRGSSWREIVRPFDSILYVSQEGDVEELRVLHTVCRKEKKFFLPAICIKQVGLAGPLVYPGSKGCWESAWRRIHQSVFSKNQHLSSFSSTAGSMLANIIAFELLKETTGTAESKQKNQFYLLDMETLEGNWHSFMPHPLVTGNVRAEWVQDFDLRLDQKLNRGESGKWFIYFSLLTSEQSGIFHSWEEVDLKQLPLAQCRVQVVDLMSEGSAELLADIICAELKHEEARREAGLAGTEAYVSRIIRQLVSTLPPLQEVEDNMVEQEGFVGVGAGETFAECVYRGLRKCLDNEFCKKQINKKDFVALVHLDKLEDELCSYYLQALTTMQGEPMIVLGREVSGFPVIWVGTNDNWHGCVGLNITMALRNALHQAVMKVQNQNICLARRGLEVSTEYREERVPINLEIPKCEVSTYSEHVRSAMQILERNRKRILTIELELEPFLKEEQIGVVGVLLREEGSR